MLRTISSEVRRAALSLLPQTTDPPLRYLSEMLVDDVIQIGQPIVVVLDDFHLIRNRAVHGLMAALLSRMPPNLQLVIASRTVPALSVSALRGRGELAEVRAPDLRFELHEAERFLDRAASQRFSPADVQGLHAQAEGWAVLLRLAALEGDPAPSPAREQPRPLRQSGARWTATCWTRCSIVSRRSCGSSCSRSRSSNGSVRRSVMP